MIRYSVLWLLLVFCWNAAHAVAEFIKPGDSRILKEGSWYGYGAEQRTVYPGSGLRFTAHGTMRLLFDEKSDSFVHVQVKSKAGVLAWEGVMDDAVTFDAGPDWQEWHFAITALQEEGFYTNSTKLSGVHFIGLELGVDSALGPAPVHQFPLRLSFFGDSITAGVVIYGRDKPWHESSDATLTYAFLAAQQLDAAYWMRGFPGAQLDELIRVFPYFSEGERLPADWTPDVVVINAGANDRKRSVQQYRSMLMCLVGLVRDTHPGCRVVLLNFFRMTPSRWPDLAYVSQQFPEGEVLCFDARPYLVDYSDGHVHPGVESHRRLGEALAAFLRTLALDSARASDDKTL